MRERVVTITIAMVLHSLWVCPSNNPALILPTNNRIFRRVILNQSKCSSLSGDDKRYYSSSSSRRDFVLLGGGLTSLSLTTCSPISGKFLLLAFIVSFSSFSATIHSQNSLPCSGSCWRRRTRPQNGFFFG